MRRFVTSCPVVLVLVSAACAEHELPEAWNPTDVDADAESSTGDPSTSTSSTTSSTSTTQSPDPPPVTTDDDDESSSTSVDPVVPDLPPEEVPLPQGLQLPFVCGDPWRLDTWGHAPALDMVREPDQHGTEGAPLLAAAAGTVNQSFYHDNAGNVIQIDHGEGWFTTYIHLESRAVEAGAVVAQGDTIGAVGRTGPTSNNHPHLHFELAIDADGDGAASWGFEGAERVIPWFDGVEYGQANAMTWRDVVSNNCP
jgi:hypothetical protein